MTKQDKLTKLIEKAIERGLDEDAFSKKHGGEWGVVGENKNYFKKWDSYA